MTPAYLREIDIIRELRLPYKVGRSLMARLKLDPTFPKPEPGTGGRRFWPLVEQWLRQHHGLGEAGVITEADGRENFNGWRQRRSGRKAGKAKRPSGTGASLSPTPRGVESSVVTPLRPGGARLSKDDAQAMAAVGHEPTSA